MAKKAASLNQKPLLRTANKGEAKPTAAVEAAVEAARPTTPKKKRGRPQKRAEDEISLTVKVDPELYQRMSLYKALNRVSIQDQLYKGVREYLDRRGGSS